LSSLWYDAAPYVDEAEKRSFKTGSDASLQQSHGYEQCVSTVARKTTARPATASKAAKRDTHTERTSKHHNTTKKEKPMKKSKPTKGKAKMNLAQHLMSVILAGALNVATVGDGHQAQP
jgi:hypothetical protein